MFEGTQSSADLLMAVWRISDAPGCGQEAPGGIGGSAQARADNA